MILTFVAGEESWKEKGLITVKITRIMSILAIPLATPHLLVQFIFPICHLLSDRNVDVTERQSALLFAECVSFSAEWVRRRVNYFVSTEKSDKVPDQTASERDTKLEDVMNGRRNEGDKEDNERDVTAK